MKALSFLLSVLFIVSFQTFIFKILKFPGLGATPGSFRFSFTFSCFTTELQWLPECPLKH
jgi:hypothetical protein